MLRSHYAGTMMMVRWYGLCGEEERSVLIYLFVVRMFLCGCYLYAARAVYGICDYIGGNGVGER